MRARDARKSAQKQQPEQKWARQKTRKSSHAFNYKIGATLWQTRDAPETIPNRTLETYAAFFRLSGARALRLALSTMKRSSRFALLSVALVGAFGLGTLAHSDSGDDRTNFAQFGAALDQISAGRLSRAQQMLEETAARVPLAESNANLLAYLQQRDGQTQEARRTLERVATPSPMSRVFLESVGGRDATPVLRPANNANASGNRARLRNNDARVAKLEQLIFRLINQERAARGLNELRWDDDLADIGRAHAAEMRDKSYFAHESPTRGLENPLDRYVEGTGRTPRLIAENIYRAWGGRSFLNESDLRVAHKALMDSPGHRANILLGSANSVGVGLVVNSTGDIWLTEMFSKP